MSETLITCENVGKKFCRDLKKSLWYGVKDSVRDLFGGRKSHSPSVEIPSDCQETAHADPRLRAGEFWANRDVNFQIKRGECLGLIGRNGAGKTTLLKMLNGLIKPDSGQITMHGQVGALIALGAGFNPLLTGRENINVNASILGMPRRQIADITDDIIEFAEITDFIDSPVRTYSSGMTVRLGFAIAACLRPDILIVDEVLAVGDADFRLKCVKRMRDVMSGGCAVLLVSHNMTDVRNLASMALWLNGGRPEAMGKPHEVITRYLGTSFSDESSITWDAETAPGGETVILRALSVDPPTGSDAISIASGANVGIRFECHQNGLSLDFTIEVRTEEQIIVFHSGGRITPNRDSTEGVYLVTARIPGDLLNSGKYNVSVIIGESQSIPLAEAINAVTFRVKNEVRGTNYSQRPGIIAPILEWNSCSEPVAIHSPMGR
jgi:ABC-type polysaccharide/polyol phosphate transport system ATPase subunit